ncbi:retrovirus-related Pol polyprotein from transposon 297 [Trichonephila clavipes]|uniref:Retrovirus-related Pol polyprotein from transposon 297 n=1 Tax=Trichonephila clavipes TaxID=2585209 RepID=A0A8X6VJH7_TRICX|nr:retrovirus-related Pol polyprotein from transposon 297 [Trichonephila clavipes]
MIRWALKLSEFNIEWEHRPGVQNVVADLLSRNPVDSIEGSQISCAALRVLAINSREQFIREQRENPELGHIYRYLENPDDGSVNATVCEGWSQDFKQINGLLFYAKPYPASRPERYKFILVISDHFTKWCELIPLRKASAQAIANALFDNYKARYGAPISLISDNGAQFISDVFEHLSHRLDIKHMKTVTYRPQANLTERVNRNLVQMIASFVEENHENWDQFLHEFAFALRAAGRKQVGKFMPKFEGPYRVLEVKGNNLIIWKSGKRVTVNIDQVRVYRPRQTDTISSDSQVETLYDEKALVIGRIARIKGSLKSTGKPLVRKVRGVDHGRSNPGRKVVDVITRPARPEQREDTAERPVRSNQATTRRPCPYYLRSRVKESDGIPKEQRNIEINSIPHSRIRRRSLSMEALDGDAVHRRI